MRFFNDAKGWGFLQLETGEDAFVHFQRYSNGRPPHIALGPERGIRSEGQHEGAVR